MKPFLKSMSLNSPWEGPVDWEQVQVGHGGQGGGGRGGGGGGEGHQEEAYWEVLFRT